MRYELEALAGVWYFDAGVLDFDAVCTAGAVCPLGKHRAAYGHVLPIGAKCQECGGHDCV